MNETMTDDLTIDADHVYRVSGRKVRGVTEILKAVGVTDHSGPWFDETSRAYGKNLHACLALLVAGRLDFDSVDDRMKEEVEAVDVWLRGIGEYTLVAVEWMAYSTTYGFAGTLDCALRIARSNRLAIIDWKRGAAGKSAALQTALYAVLASERLAEPIDGRHPTIPFSQIDRYALDGIKTGKPKVRAFTDRSDIAGALGAVALCNWCDMNNVTLQGEAR